SDSVTVSPLDTAYRASTTIFGGAGTDSITQTANLTLCSMPSAGHLTYQAEKILLSGSLQTPGTATYDTGNSASSVGVSQSAGATITASKLLLLGKGTFSLNEANDVGTLAANVNGTISYNDINALTIGTVGTTNGITTSDDDVKLTVLLGGLAINQAINLGAGDLTLDVRGAAAVTQSATGLITASGLQLLGSGTVNLDQDGNNVVTIAANYNGTISYRD